MHNYRYLNIYDILICNLQEHILDLTSYNQDHIDSLYIPRELKIEEVMTFSFYMIYIYYILKLIWKILYLGNIIFSNLQNVLFFNLQYLLINLQIHLLIRFIQII